MIYVKEDFKNRNLVQERQTIPKAFVYEHSVEGGKIYALLYLYIPLTKLFEYVYTHARKFVCFYIVDFTSVCTYPR